VLALASVLALEQVQALASGKVLALYKVQVLTSEQKQALVLALELGSDPGFGAGSG
jgi:hypothetical protein